MPIPSLTSTLKSRVQSTKKQESSASKSSPSPPPEGSGERSRVRASTTASIHHASAVNGARKQSQLPQPGEIKYASRTVRDDSARRPTAVGAMLPPPLPLSTKSNDATAPGRPAASGVPTRLRPRSMYQTSSHDPRPHAALASNPRSTPDHSAEAPFSARSSNVTRSQSLRKPASTAHAAPPGSPRTHNRTQSVDIAGLTKGQTVEPRARQERPRSLVIPSSDVKKAANDGPSDSSARGAPDTTRLATIRRSASVRTGPVARHPPEPTTSGSRAGAAPEKRPTPSVHGNNAEQTKGQPRPAFSTLQQHYTPRKVGKAPTSTFLRPPAPEVEAHAIPPDMVAVQAELLQLHLLHESADRATKEWELSAKRSLHHRFDEVAGLHRAMLESELKDQEQQNLQALIQWSQTSSSCSFVEHIQILSGPLQELPLLLHPGGRFERLVADFQRWATWVEDIWAARNNDSPSAPGNLASAEPLGDSWRAENASLLRKLTSFQRDLSRLAKPPPHSSIACIVGACSQLVDGILEELVVMRKIQDDIVKVEREWVEATLQLIARDVGQLLCTEEDTEAWRQ